jgi:hypothetical protein
MYLQNLPSFCEEKATSVRSVNSMFLKPRKDEECGYLFLSCENNNLRLLKETQRRIQA